MLLTGIGVGLTLPTLISAAATALPPERFGTGSAVLNTGRQVAAALGVAVFVTVLGVPATAASAVIAFRHGWLVAAAASVVAAAASVFVRRPRAAIPSPAPAAAQPQPQHRPGVAEAR
jgi:MFS family permease